LLGVGVTFRNRRSGGEPELGLEWMYLGRTAVMCFFVDCSEVLED
jgi:hypothetical protein